VVALQWQLGLHGFEKRRNAAISPRERIAAAWPSSRADRGQRRA
jgi:hypothetical protein